MSTTRSLPPGRSRSRAWFRLRQKNSNVATPRHDTPAAEQRPTPARAKRTWPVRVDTKIARPYLSISIGFPECRPLKRRSLTALSRMPHGVYASQAMPISRAAPTWEMPRSMSKCRSISGPERPGIGWWAASYASIKSVRTSRSSCSHRERSPRTASSLPILVARSRSLSERSGRRGKRQPAPCKERGPER